MRMKDKILYLIGQGLSNVEIAERLGTTAQHVATTRYRAKQVQDSLHNSLELNTPPSILVPPKPENQYAEGSKKYEESLRATLEVEHLRKHAPLKEIRLLASKCKDLVPENVIKRVLMWTNIQQKQETTED